MSKYKYIDEQYFTSILSQQDWYIQLEKFLDERFWNFAKNRIDKSQEWYDENNEFVDLVLDLLRQGKIGLNSNQLGFNKKRKEIDTVILHHSSRESDEDIEVTAEALSLIRIYAKDFFNKENRYFGKPITSDHYYNGRMTFLPYHYVIWPDGKYIQYLQDSDLSWHCGNWDYNCRSIAICFHADLENSEPTHEAINTAKEIIKKYQPKEVLGHREVSNSTTCPGGLFLGKNGWKNKLIN